MAINTDVHNTPTKTWSYPVLMQGAGTSKIYLFTDPNTATIVADPVCPAEIGKHYTRANIYSSVYAYFSGSISLTNSN